MPAATLVSANDVELPEHRGTEHDHREALLESRTFFPEKRGQYKDWEENNPKLVGKAVVLVDKLPDDEPANQVTGEADVDDPDL